MFGFGWRQWAGLFAGPVPVLLVQLAAPKPFGAYLVFCVACAVMGGQFGAALDRRAGQ